MEHDATTQDKVSSKLQTELDNHKKIKDEMEVIIRKMRD